MTLGKISNIPVEITSLIFSFMDSLSMYRCSQTCKKWRAIAGAEEYWEAKCLEGLSHIPDAKTIIEEIQRECSDASKCSHHSGSKIAYPNLKVFYMAFFQKNKDYLGLYHKDYSFYMGGLIRIRFATRQERTDLAPCLLIGEAVICPNNDDDEMENFSLLPAIEIHQLKNSRVTSRILFGIGGAPTCRLHCFSKGVKFVHDALVVDVECGEEEDAVVPLDMSLQGIMSRIQKNQFPTGTPDPTTGLWTFPNFNSEQTLYSFTMASTLHRHAQSTSRSFSSSHRQPASKIMSLTCDKKCHQNRVRASGGNSALLEYTTKLSKINVQEEHIPRPVFHHNQAPLDFFPRPKAGVWMANYGTHGNELTLLAYHTQPHTHSEETPATSFSLYKITGDMNVPRGEETVTVSDLSMHTTHIGRSLFDISQSTEFGQDRGRVYKGKGRIAMEGYWNANHVDCDVIVRGERELFVYWYGLFEEAGDENAGGMGWMSRYVFQDL